MRERQHQYIPSDYLMACDECGVVFRRSELQQRWDKAWVCRKDWEPKHPQESVRGKIDRQRVPVSRPEGSIIYVVRDVEWPDMSVNNYSELYQLGASTNAIYVKGRDSAGDGGGGVFVGNTSDLSSQVTLDTLRGLYVPFGSDLTGASGAWVRQFEDYKPEYFTANATPGTTDMTTAIETAFSFAKTAKGVLMLSGIYGVSKVSLFDAIDLMVRADSAELKAISTTAQTAVLEIDNAYEFVLEGKLLINGSNNTNYDNGLLLKTSAGSSLGGNGAITRATINNVIFLNCKNALKIGAYNVDTQLSELFFSNLNMIGCPGAVYHGGSQAVASFIGCSLVSEPNANYPAAPEYLLRQEGGSVSVLGGEAVLAAGTIGTAAILLQPSSSSTYSSPYGQFKFIGALVETGATPLLQIENPRSITTPSSSQSVAVFTSCGGYVGAAPTVTLITVSDATYAGTINAHSNNFYIGVGESARTAYTIDASTSLTKIDIDKGSFSLGFPDWIEGINGGILIHGLEHYLYVSDLDSQQVLASATDTLLFKTAKVTDQHYRGSLTYNPVNGTYVVPAGGAKRLRIEAYCKAASGSPAGVIRIVKDSVDDAEGVISGNTLYVSGDYYDVAKDTTFEIEFNNTSAGPVAFGASAMDKLQIFIEN